MNRDLAVNVADLAESQQIRLTHILDEYLQSLEAGLPFDVPTACDDEPELCHAVEVYLSKLNSLVGLAKPASVAIPNSLGAFTLIREIGRGGMGIVYEATQAGMDRRVALKVLSISPTNDAHQIMRFKNESRAAGALHHPHIVPVYSVGESDGLHYYAMQLIEGTTVEQWIRRAATESESLPSRRVDWQSVVDWAIDAAAALHNAHESGVVHRDVKPSNLMIDHDSKLWVTDFGLARCQANHSLTRTGDLIGTMRYMSPEQARGQSALVDGRSDIYSLAATVYEMLTLRPAHVGDDGPSLLKIIDEQPVTPLRRLCPSLPRDLETVLAKAMAKSRDQRYETAAALADDLRRVLHDEPTIARPPTPVDRLGRWAAKHQRGVSLSFLVIAIGLVGFAISTAKIAASAARWQRSELLARQAVDRLGSQMAELLQDIPSAQGVRQTLLRDTLNYYETFAAANERSAEVSTEVALTYGKIGTIQRELGCIDDAISSLRASEHRYEQLAAASPTDVTAQRDWAISQNNLAESLQAAGRLEEAAAMFARAIAMLQRLLDRQSDVATRRQLAATLNNLGLLLAQTGVIDEAEIRYRSAIELLSQPIDSKDVSDDGQQLASIRANLSGLVLGRDPQLAVRLAGESLDELTRAVAASPGDAKLAMRVVVTLNALGAAQSAAGQPDAAMETFQRAVDIGQQLHLRWPDHAMVQRDLVLSFNHVGLAQTKSGQWSEARDAFEQAMTHQRLLVELFADDAETHSLLGGVLNNLGFLHRQLGDRPAAARSYEEAVTQQSIAVQLAPEVDRYQTFLRKHQHNLDELRQAS